MKSAERPRSFCRAITAKTRSARSAGSAGDLVEDQQLRVAGERARQVDHAQQRQRHVDRLLAEVDLQVELAQLPPHLGDGVPCQAHVLRDRQVGHERRILEDGASPIRAACAGDETLSPCR